jgi:hypothetical protein
MWSSSKEDAWEANEANVFRRNMTIINSVIFTNSFFGFGWPQYSFKKQRMKHSAPVIKVLILIATSGRNKCEMSCYCTHIVQASLNRDSRCTDQWTNRRMCSVKTHAYWKRPWFISVSVLMCEQGSSVFSLSEPRDGHYENRGVIRLGRIFVHRFPGAYPASHTVGTGLRPER